MTEPVGEQLKQIRTERGIPLENVAQFTRIRVRYLRAIEEGDFNALPSPAQARGFVRSYANFLKIDPVPLLKLLGEDVPHLSVSPASRPFPPAHLEEPPVQPEGAFAAIGARLRSQRELLGLTLEDVEGQTHLRIHYLQAMEAGSLKDLPSPVQGRGMLKIYASFIGLDPEPLLLRFAEGLQARLAVRQGERPARRPPAERRPVSEVPLMQRLFSLDFIAGALVVLGLGGFLVWGAIRIIDIRSLSAAQTTTPTARSVADVLLSTPEPIVQPGGTITSTLPGFQLTAVIKTTLVPAGFPTGGELETTQPAGLPTDAAAVDLTPSPSPTFAPDLSSAPVQVNVVVRQRAWMRVTVDGKVEFEGRVIPGGAFNFAGDERIELLTGNGAGLQVFYNQADLGQLGLFGQVVNLVFTRDGIIVPTPTITPTSEATSPQTPPETPTETPTPTPTATPKVGS